MTDPSESPAILKVAVFPPAPLDKHLDYLPPAGITEVAPGTRVRVTLGKQQKLGLVMEQADRSDIDVARLRRADEILDSSPIISDDMIKLLVWVSGYYHCPLGQVLAQTLPNFFRLGKSLERHVPKVWFAHRHVDERKLLHAPKQKQLYDLLSRYGPISESVLDDTFKDWRRIAKELADKGLIDRRKVDMSRGPAQDKLSLNVEQAAVVEQIKEGFDRFLCHLLDGITNSGKTEVYMRIAEQALQNGKQVLVLVPEIGLISQTLQRFERRFGTCVAAFHSDMGEVRRTQAWYQAYLNDFKIIVGTRSAIFIPFAELGLIVVDEEHDISYKQNDRLRYHARDLAVKRAQLLDVPIVLGSATPSLESFHHALDGRYRYHRLTRQVGKASAPAFEVINLCRQPVQAGLSRRLVDMMREHLQRDEQVLLFLNRRGYAPKMLCHHCGAVIECTRCDAALTYHAHNRTLVCHHCGKVSFKPDACSQCGKSDLLTIGVGTERIEERLQALFSDIGIERIDADSTQRRGELEKRLKAVRSGDARILVGTQMISKGHHFPNVTLTGVINVDQRLFASDFRSVEQFGQLIVQVAGRAGRGDKPGVVALQTHHPEHLSLRQLLDAGYHDFAKTLLSERRLATMPPYQFLALLKAEDQKIENPSRFLEFAARQIKRYADGKLEVLGPVPLTIERRRNCYRAQLLINAADRLSLNRTLAKALPAIRADKLTKKIRWFLDVDPIEME